MIEIKHILCPIDFSDFSRRALDLATAIAHWYGSRITVLHVTPSVTSLIPPSPVPLYPPIVLTADDLEQFRRELETFAAESEPAQRIEALVAEGGITAEIVRVAQELPADLVVMGTHGRSGFDRLMLGSVTERMLRKAPCPLLTVPCSAPDAVPSPGAPFRRILCAVDFSPSSLRALSFAESLASEADAHLDVLQVVEPMSVFEPVPMGGPSDPTIDSRVRTARHRLDEVVSPDARIYSQVVEIVAAGKPHVEILREASDRRTELIVMGTHGGRTGLLAFGSTTNHVVRNAVCPVLTVKP